MHNILTFILAKYQIIACRKKHLWAEAFLLHSIHQDLYYRYEIVSEIFDLVAISFSIFDKEYKKTRK